MFHVIWAVLREYSIGATVCLVMPAAALAAVHVLRHVLLYAWAWIEMAAWVIVIAAGIILWNWLDFRHGVVSSGCGRNK